MFAIVFKYFLNSKLTHSVVKGTIMKCYPLVQVFIDGNGDAEGNFSVVALMDDAEANGTVRMSMQPVGYFQYTSNKNVLPVMSHNFLI